MKSVLGAGQLAFALALGGAIAACGQGPSFLENQNVNPMSSGKAGNGSTGTSNADGTQAGTTPDVKTASDDVPIMIDDHGNVIKNPGAASLPGSGTTGSGTTGATTTPAKPIVVGPDPGYKLPPSVDDGDAAALHECLMKLNGQLPQKFKYYHKIVAQVSVFGVGTAINDQLRTDGPALTLVVAGVNVGGTPIYNFLNPNGYYCIKVGVNVMTNLTVNVHCNARLADSKINVNVGSTVNDSTAGIGVAVMSTINVVTQRPAGDTCIR